jgi:hypothetical protein
MAEVVSGVGKNARRTDMNTSSKLTQGMKDRIPPTYYGEQTDLNQIQAGADLQGPSYEVPRISAPMPLPSNEPVVPFTQDTLRQDEPAEFGMPFGPGPGPEILLPQQAVRGPKLSTTFYDISQADPDLQPVAEELAARGL